MMKCAEKYLFAAARACCVLVATVVLLAACSNRAIYQGIQQNQLQLCEQQPIPQQKSCRAQYQKPFEQYQRELEELRQESASSSNNQLRVIPADQSFPRRFFSDS